jgi:hypothetical protein
MVKRMNADLREVSRDAAAAAASRDILAEQLHAATTAMAEQVSLEHFHMSLQPPDRVLNCSGNVHIDTARPDFNKARKWAATHCMILSSPSSLFAIDRQRSSLLQGQELRS